MFDSPIGWETRVVPWATKMNKKQKAMQILVLAKEDASGSTTKVPVNINLSPGFALSTASFLIATSIVRGKHPEGTSSAFS